MRLALTDQVPDCRRGDEDFARDNAPLPLALGSNCWVMMPWMVVASWVRICCCWWAGKTSIIRSIDWGASWVWRVAKTRCPVSAAVRAVEIVSRSRSSPIEDHVRVLAQDMLEASAKPLVSSPTSLWLTTAVLWVCRYSIGSSTDMIWRALVWLIMSIREARVVDLPEPVGPVTRRDHAEVRRTGAPHGDPQLFERLYLERDGAETAPTASRCWKTFNRNRPTPGTTCEVSSSRLVSKRSLCAETEYRKRGLVPSTASSPRNLPSA